MRSSTFRPGVASAGSQWIYRPVEGEREAWDLRPPPGHALCSPCDDRDYSMRNATIGSTPAARRTGAIEAIRAANASINVAPISINGSHGCTPYN